MAQPQITTPTLHVQGGAALSDHLGGVAEQAIDIWSRYPDAQLGRPPMTVTHKTDPTEIPRVLSAWRAAERQLADHVEASPVRFAILSEIVRLRTEYHRLFALATR